MFTLHESNGVFMSLHGFLKSVVAFLVLVVLAIKNHCLKQDWRTAEIIVVKSKKYGRYFYLPYLCPRHTTMFLEVLHPCAPLVNIGFRNRHTIFENVFAHTRILTHG
jgi:hypothetical protein